MVFIKGVYDISSTILYEKKCYITEPRFCTVVGSKMYVGGGRLPILSDCDMFYVFEK